MGYGVAVQIEGEYALFSRPELKTERYSYNVITPSAARNLIQAIYWKPQIEYRIKRIHVYNEFEFTNIRRNEVGAKASSSDAKALMKKSPSGKGYINTTKEIQQRAATVLKNVNYIVEVEFDMTGIKSTEEDTPAKHYNMLLRRLRQGQQYSQPYLGVREFPAKVTLVEGDIPPSDLKGTRDLGVMLYDLDYSNKRDLQADFFHAVMVDGVIDLRDVKKVR